MSPSRIDSTDGSVSSNVGPPSLDSCSSPNILHTSVITSSRGFLVLSSEGVIAHFERSDLPRARAKAAVETNRAVAAANSGAGGGVLAASTGGGTSVGSVQPFIQVAPLTKLVVWCLRIIFDCSYADQDLCSSR